MNPEIETYSRYLRDKIVDIHTALSGLSGDQLKRAPDVPGGNSPFVIATHTFGNMRAWVLGIACGRDLRRDRPAEFVSSGSHEELGVAAGRLSGEVEEALRALDPATLNDRFLPLQELWGEGEPREISRREALIHPLEHAAIHLGQIHVTVDMLRAAQ